MKRHSKPTEVRRVLFDCAICVAVTSLMLIGAIGLLVVLRVEPFDKCQ